MTALPDPAELAPTRDPRAYGRPRMLSGAFWMAMAFGVLCLIAAVLVLTLGPRLFAQKPVPRVAAAANPSIPDWAALASASRAIPLPAPGAAVDVSALAIRIGRLEAGQARALDAAAGALAAAALSDAAAQSRPFAVELTVYQRVLPPSANALALQSLAAEGAPTRAALAAELATLAARASVAAKAPADSAGIMERIAYAVSRVVNVRRVDAVGGGPDALIAKAQRAAADGDLEGALVILQSLGPTARAPLEAWNDKARRRIAIDRAVAGLRDEAVAALADARPTSPARTGP